MNMKIFIDDLVSILRSFVVDDGMTPSAVLRQLATGTSTRVGEEISYTLNRYTEKYGVSTAGLLERALALLGDSALSEYMCYRTAATARPEAAMLPPAISIIDTPLTPRSDDGSVLAALQSRMYKDDQVDVGNPVKYLMDRMNVSPDTASAKQLVEAMEAARIAEVNTAKNAASTFKARRFNVDEMIEVLLRSAHSLPAKKGQRREYVRALSAELKAEKGEHWNSTEFLKNVKVATSAHYGEAHMAKVTSITDFIF